MADPLLELLAAKREARKVMARGLEQSTTDRQRRNWRKWIKQNEIEIAALQSVHEQIIFAAALKTSAQKMLR